MCRCRCAAAAEPVICPTVNWTTSACVRIVVICHALAPPPRLRSMSSRTLIDSRLAQENQLPFDDDSCASSGGKSDGAAVVAEQDCAYGPHIVARSANTRNWLLITPPPIRERSIVVSVSVCPSVCLCVCLSVHDHIFGTTSQIFTKFLVHVTRVCGSVYFGGVVICYVHSFLWMTSYLHISWGCSTSPPRWGSEAHTQP